MQKELGKEYINSMERKSYLEDNCDEVKEIGHMKPFTHEQLQEQKENLASISIEIDGLETEKREHAKYFNQQLKPLVEQRKDMISSIKSKAEYVIESCYKFIDEDEKKVGFYNANGDLVEERPATANELNLTIFSIARKTGTNE